MKIKEIGERRVFYVDVGDLSPEKATAYIERIKKEMDNKNNETKSDIN